MKLLIIVAEKLLRSELISEIKAAGATGYTAFEVFGEGSTGRRSGEIPGENVRLDVLLDEDTCTRLMQTLSDKYFENYSLVCYSLDAEVLRGEKFRGKGGRRHESP